MTQRRPRLGDILDDYCTRERRLTNHAVVAMVEDEVKLTRCTTCDTEHEFKHGKMPALRRKKDAASAAYKEVLAAVTGDAAPAAVVVPAQAIEEAPAAVAPAARPAPEPAVEPVAASPAPPVAQVSTPQPSAGAAEVPDDAEAGEPAAGKPEDGRVHRRLIRATLPRPENHVPERPIPEFTMRQPTERGGKFRGGGGRGAGGRQAANRGGGQFGGHQRGPVFGRPPGGRSGSPGNRAPVRGDAHRPHRDGQPGRHGKKHSK